MRIDAEELFLVLLGLALLAGYLLFGAFWAEIFGLESAPAYYAMVLLWPVIGIALCMIGAMVFTLTAGMISLIIGVAKS